MKNSWKAAAGAAVLGLMSFGTACNSNRSKGIAATDKPEAMLQNFKGDAVGRFAESFQQQREQDSRSFEEYMAGQNALETKVGPLKDVFDFLEKTLVSREPLDNGEKHYFSVYSGTNPCAWFTLESLSNCDASSDLKTPSMTFYLQDDRVPHSKTKSQSDVRSVVLAQVVGDHINIASAEFYSPGEYYLFSELDFFKRTGFKEPYVSPVERYTDMEQAIDALARKVDKLYPVAAGNIVHATKAPPKPSP